MAGIQNLAGWARDTGNPIGYRYIGVDLLTRTVVEDLPLYGVNMDRAISKAGNFTGTFKLHTNEMSDTDLLSASQPGLRAVFVLRGNVCVWAGPIWSRTYNTVGNTCELSAQTFESAFAKIKVQQKFNNQFTDQTIIFKNLIDAMQGQASSNFGFVTSGIVASGIQSALVVEPYEHRMYADAMGDLLKMANSFDYMIDYTFDINTNAITLPVKVGYPALGWNQDGIDLDFPGSLYSYTYPESASKGVVDQTTLGLGEGSSMLVAEWVNADLLNNGYPAWANVDSSNKSVNNSTMLQRIAQETGQTNAIPVVIPNIQLRLTSDIDDSSVTFEEWGNLGMPVNLNIMDDRFSSGITLRHRMLGWSLTPPDETTIESLSITLEGQDSAA